jgi:hypothetical protein
MNGLITVLAQHSTIFETENDGCPILANVAARELWRSFEKRQSLVFAGKLVGLVDFYITIPAQSSLVRATYH